MSEQLHRCCSGNHSWFHASDAMNASIALCPIKYEGEEAEHQHDWTGLSDTDYCRKCGELLLSIRLTGRNPCPILGKPEALPATTGKGPMELSGYIIEAISALSEIQVELLRFRGLPREAASLTKARLALLNAFHTVNAPSEGRATDEQGCLPVTPNSPPDGTNDAHWIEPGEAPSPALSLPLSEETKEKKLGIKEALSDHAQTVLQKSPCGHLARYSTSGVLGPPICFACERAELAFQVEALSRGCVWLDEFVEAPETFPSEGDYQWWRERRDGIRNLAGKAILSLAGSSSPATSVPASPSSPPSPSPLVSVEEWRVFDIGGIGVRDIQTNHGRIIDVPSDKAEYVVEHANASLASLTERIKELESSETQWTPLRKKILTPANCGVSGHFEFQENGGHCMMCQREKQLTASLTSRLEEAERIVAERLPFIEQASAWRKIWDDCEKYIDQGQNKSGVDCIIGYISSLRASLAVAEEKISGIIDAP